MNPTKTANFKATMVAIVIVGFLVTFQLAFMYREKIRQIGYENIEACTGEYLGRSVSGSKTKSGCPEKLGIQFKDLRKQIESKLGPATDSSHVVYRDTNSRVWCLSTRNGKSILERYDVVGGDFGGKLVNKIIRCRVYDSIPKLPSKSEILKETPLFEPLPKKS